VVPVLNPAAFPFTIIYKPDQRGTEVWDRPAGTGRCSTPGEAGLLARLGREGKVMDTVEQDRIVDLVRPYVERLAFYHGVF
jgi:hypothetical protein